MNWPVATLVVGLLLIAALIVNARAYSARVERQWPASGRFVAIDGVRLHLFEDGARDAPSIVFLHGANANAREPLVSEAKYAQDGDRGK